MTQQGFKKFRRRAQVQPEVQEQVRPEPDEAVLENVPPGLQSEPAEILPTTLPSPWERLARISFDPDRGGRDGAPLASAVRTDPAGRAFDLLRTRLLQTLKARGWNRVAVTAPTGGCGATFCAVNLALSLARVPSSRTILMDLNFRSPGVGPAMGLVAAGDMASFLSGTRPVEEALVRPLGTLAVGLNATPDLNAAEILHDSRSAAVLDHMVADLDPETVVFDLPPMLEYDDAAAFLPQVDGVLVISDGTQTTAAHLAACERILNGNAPLLGVVLNRGRATADIGPVA